MRAMERNTTLLRLPLQGNRVAEQSLKAIEQALARNGAQHPTGSSLGVDENAGSQSNGVAQGPSTPGSLRVAVRARTLESAINLQQAIHVGWQW